MEWATSDELAEALRAAGVPEGGIVMVHARISALPWIPGGTESVVRAVIDAVGADGTVAAFAGWEDNPYHLASWPADKQRAYKTGMPPYDPAVSECRRSHGRFPERLRTWPGARRGPHPEMNLVAVGPRADWLTRGTLEEDPWDERSPLGRLVEAGGTVLLLGSPLSTLTVIHHAERVAKAEPKRWHTYEMPVRVNHETQWREFRAIETSQGAFDYDQHTNGESYIELIGRSALEAGIGHRANVLGAQCHLFPANDLVEHAVAWIDERF